MGQPAIILTSQFRFSDIGKLFGGFLGYIGREEAIEEEKRREVTNSDIYFSDEKIDNHIRNEIINLLHSEEKDFDGFLGYMKRSEAILNEPDTQKKIDSFINSEMFNNKFFEQQATQYTGLFTSNRDNLTNDEVKKYEEIFLKAQENDSFLWQDVVSFSEEFAKESGLIDSKTNEVAQSKIIEATRKMMQLSFEKENMTETGLWVASVHVNTDNLHVHVATVETVNTRPMKTFIDENGYEYRQRKGMRKQSTLDQMKYTFFNAIHSEKDLLVRINELRNELIKDILPKSFNHAKENQKIQKLLRSIEKEAQNIPQGKRKWAYKTQSDKNKKNIQEVLKILLKENSAYKEFREKARQYSDTRQEAYGQSKYGKKDNQNYRNRMNDLENRLGNSLLKQIKQSSEGKSPNLFQEKNVSSIESKSVANQDQFGEAVETLKRHFTIRDKQLKQVKTGPSRKNYQQFSSRNQEKIKRAYGKKKAEKVTLLSEEKWKKLSYEPKPDAKGVWLTVPKMELNKDGNVEKFFQKRRYFDKSEMFTRNLDQSNRKVQIEYKSYPGYRLSYRDLNHLKRLGYETYRDWQAEQFHQSIQRKIEWEQERMDYSR